MCTKPSIANGMVSPSTATVDYGATYQVVCDKGFRNYQSDTMRCGADRTFDTNPTCGKQ